MITGRGQPNPAAFYLQPLSWHHLPGRPDDFELRAIPGPVGSLTFERRGIGIARTPDATWRFGPHGFFRRDVLITSLPTQTPLALCRFPVWGTTGQLALPPDHALHLTTTRWDRRLVVSTARAEVVLSYDLRGALGVRSPVTWGPAAHIADKVPWLLFFAWYLAVRRYREASGVAAAVIASS